MVHCNLTILSIQSCSLMASANDICKRLQRALGSESETAALKLRSEQFGALNSNRDRVDFAWKLLHERGLFPEVKDNCKNNDLSEKFRKDGNKEFGLKRDHAAFDAYTRSIAHATGDGDCLALAFANRSAVMFQRKLYRECLNVSKLC